MGACLAKSRTSDGQRRHHNHRQQQYSPRYWHHQHSNRANNSASSSGTSNNHNTSGSSSSSSSSTSSSRGAGGVRSREPTANIYGSSCSIDSLSDVNFSSSSSFSRRFACNSTESYRHSTSRNNCEQSSNYVNSTNNNNRFWTIQTKLSMHADRLVIDSLESIRPTVLNEPSNSMQKLHMIAEQETGWLVVINSLINKVDIEHPFGSAFILLILEDSPLPSRKTISQLDEILCLQMHRERSVAKQRNISIVLACLAEKLAGSLSQSLFSKSVQDYLLSRIEPENDLNVILFSLIALEKFSQTIDNKFVIVDRLKQMGDRNPLLKLEHLSVVANMNLNADIDRNNKINSINQSSINDQANSRIGCIPAWTMANASGASGNCLSLKRKQHQHITTTNHLDQLNALADDNKVKSDLTPSGIENSKQENEEVMEDSTSSINCKSSVVAIKSISTNQVPVPILTQAILTKSISDTARKQTSQQLNDNYLAQQVSFCAKWHLDNYFLVDGRPYTYETIDKTDLNAMLNYKDVSENLKISPDGLSARNDTSRFESVRCTYPITSGIYYYEAQLVTPGVMQIGLATKKSKFLNHDGYGIGDDDDSVAYDGCRQLIWQSADSIHTGLPRWKEGDIVGCLINLDKFEVRFSLNGILGEPNSGIFKNKSLSTQYYAAASFMPFQQCTFNFGRVPFKYPPIDYDFKAFNQCCSLSDSERTVLPRHIMLKKVHSSNLMINTCTICCDNIARVTLQPCNHNGFCEVCANILEICPLCRTGINFRKIVQ